MICDKDVLVCGFFSYVIVVRCLDIVCKIWLINVFEFVGFLLMLGGSKYMFSMDVDEELVRVL